MGHYSSQPVSQVLPGADAAFDLKGAGSDTSSAQNDPRITVPKADISDSEVLTVISLSQTILNLAAFVQVCNLTPIVILGLHDFRTIVSIS